MRQFWTHEQIEILRDRYGTVPAPELARVFGKTVKSVHYQAHRQGLMKPRVRTDAAFMGRLAALHAEGLSDQDVADALGCERHTVSVHRRRLGLPSNSHNERHRQKTREIARRQCEAAGVDSLGAYRSLVFAERAERAGWPAWCRVREVQVLDTLSATGPMTRRELAAAIGLPWAGTRKTFKCKGGRGSYLANLQAAGLVVSLGRVVRSGKRGGNAHLYTLALDTERTARSG